MNKDLRSGDANNLQPKDMPKVAKLRRRALALATADAYSHDRYGSSEWIKAVFALADRGYDATEVEVILRSKWMRWAADASNNSGNRGRAADLLIFMDNKRNKANVADLMKECVA